MLSVCAYFPNLDMGSELQAQRVYVKLAWLSPFHSPDLAAAQHRDALHRWDYWLQRASCLKPSPRGTGWAERCPGTPLLPSHCFLPFRRAVEGRKSAAVPPPFSCAWKISCTRLVHLGRSGQAFSSSAIIIWLENSCLHGWVCFKTGEQLYRVVSLMLVGCLCTWGEERQSTCFSPLGDKVLRATWSLALREEKLQFFQSTA